MSLPSSLSLDPLPASLLASDPRSTAQLLALAQAELATFPDPARWKRLRDRPGSKFAGEGPAKAKVESFASDEGWAGRRSEHGADELSWDEVLASTWEDHYAVEQRCVHSFTSSHLLSPLAAPSPLPAPFPPDCPTLARAYALHYTLPFPLARRTFVVGLVQAHDAARGEVWNVTVPLAHEAVRAGDGEEKGRVRGAYVSVERFRQVEGGRRIEWSMITLSNPGGNIPFALTKRTVPGEIAKDVSGLIEYVRGVGRWR